MRLASVQSCAWVVMLTLLVAAPAVAVQNQRDTGGASATGVSCLAPPSDASGYYYSQRIRNGFSYAEFSYMGYQSDASGYYQADGYFESIEGATNLRGYFVGWSSYNSATGVYTWAYGLAPSSAVKAHGDTLTIDFDSSTLVDGYSWPVPTSWSGTFVPHKDGPYSERLVVSGTQGREYEYYYCTQVQRLSGTGTSMTSDFVGTCGLVVVTPEVQPWAYPNGRWTVFRGTGCTAYRCGP